MFINKKVTTLFLKVLEQPSYLSSLFYLPLLTEAHGTCRSPFSGNSWMILDPPVLILPWVWSSAQTLFAAGSMAWPILCRLRRRRRRRCCRSSNAMCRLIWFSCKCSISYRRFKQFRCWLLLTKSMVWQKCDWRQLIYLRISLWWSPGPPRWTPGDPRFVPMEYRRSHESPRTTHGPSRIIPDCV